MGLVYWYYLCKLMIFDGEYMFGKICFFEIRKESLLNIAFPAFYHFLFTISNRLCYDNKIFKINTIKHF